MLDVDGLKTVNDTQGHQRGDELLRTFARAIAANPRGTDRAYRVGGDEFAVNLHDAGEWEAFEFAQRLHASLAALDGGRASQRRPVSQRRSGCVQGRHDPGGRPRAHERQALSPARGHLHPRDEALQGSASEAHGDRNKRALARALALAVDAKDSYTRSHSQTVATLCALIATELGLEAGRWSRCGSPGSCMTLARSAFPTRSSKSRQRSTIGSSS